MLQSGSMPTLRPDRRQCSGEQTRPWWPMNFNLVPTPDIATLSGVYFWRGQTILIKREKIKRQTIEYRRLQYRTSAE